MSDENREKENNSEKLEQEPLPKAKRIVIYGTVSSGALELKEGLEKYLERFKDKLEVKREKNVYRIEEAFYGTENDGEKSIPTQVILFPEMRQYFLEAETISSYEDTIMGGEFAGKKPEEIVSKLCEENNVPLVKVDKDAGNDFFTNITVNDAGV